MQRVKNYAGLAGSILIAVFLAYLLAFYGVIDSASRAFVVFTDIAPMAAALFGIVAVVDSLTRFNRDDPPARLWLLIAFSLILNFAAETAWFVYEGVRQVEVPIPSIADYIWLAAYAPLIVAIFAVLVGYRRLGLNLDWSRVKWVVPLITAIVLVVTFGLALPIFGSAEASAAEKLVNPAYVILDLMILLPALILAFTLGRGAAGKPWALICLAFAVMGIGDITFIWLEWNGSYYMGNPIDLFWISGYLLLGLAGVLATRDLSRKGKAGRAAPAGNAEIL
jgi:hypothetical protein